MKSLLLPILLTIITSGFAYAATTETSNSLEILNKVLTEENSTLSSLYGYYPSKTTIAKAFKQAGVTSTNYINSWGNGIYLDWDSGNAVYQKSSKTLQKLIQEFIDHGAYDEQEQKAINEHVALLNDDRELLIWLFEQHLVGNAQSAFWIEQGGLEGADRAKATQSADAWSHFTGVISEEIRALGRRTEFSPITFGEQPDGVNEANNNFNISNNEEEGEEQTPLEELQRIYTHNYKRYQKASIKERGSFYISLKVLASEIKNRGGKLPYPLPNNSFKAPPRGKSITQTEKAKSGFKNRATLPEDYTDSNPIRTAENNILQHIEIPHKTWVEQWRKNNPDKKDEVKSEYLASIANNAKLTALLHELFLARRGYALSQAGIDQTGGDAKLIKQAKNMAEKALTFDKKIGNVQSFVDKNNKLFNDYKKAITYFEGTAGSDPILKAGQYSAMINILKGVKKIRMLSVKQHDFRAKMLKVTKTLLDRQLTRGLKNINAKLKKGEIFASPPLDAFVKPPRPELKSLVNALAIKKLYQSSTQHYKARKKYLNSRKRHPNKVSKSRFKANENARQRVNSARPR